jgi:hypothetical protein
MKTWTVYTRITAPAVGVGAGQREATQVQAESLEIAKRYTIDLYLRMGFRANDITILDESGCVDA